MRHTQPSREATNYEAIHHLANALCYCYSLLSGSFRALFLRLARRSSKVANAPSFLEGLKGFVVDAGVAGMRGDGAKVNRKKRRKKVAPDITPP